jgi:hypothetical protein
MVTPALPPDRSDDAADVFISYSRHDVDKVVAIARHLESAGVSIWRDGDRLLGGELYVEQIADAIGRSKVVLLMCSAQALASENVTKEVVLTWDFSHRRYIPLMLEPGVEIPSRFQYCLAGCQRVEVGDRPESAWLPEVLLALAKMGIACGSPRDPTLLVPAVPPAPPPPQKPARESRFRPGQCPLPGTDLELVELLGTGGFGEVWKAVNSQVRGLPPVALKFCLDPETQAVLRHEAEIVAQVLRHGRHEGIVPLLHTYLSADPPALEYEYVDGGDLTAYIRAGSDGQGTLSASKATRIVTRLAEIMAFAHRAQPAIVHRDLKPSNVLVERRGPKAALRISDFGIGGVSSRRILSQTSSGRGGDVAEAMLKGTHTPLYASPQQVRGEPADPRDDVHALGVIWYQLLTGDLTTGAPTGRRWAAPLRQRGLSAGAVNLLASCFESRAEDRPASAVALHKELLALAPAAVGPAGAAVPADEEMPWVLPAGVPRGRPAPEKGSLTLPPAPPVKAGPTRPPAAEETAPRPVAIPVGPPAAPPPKTDAPAGRPTAQPAGRDDRATKGPGRETRRTSPPRADGGARRPTAGSKSSGLMWLLGLGGGLVAVLLLISCGWFMVLGWRTTDTGPRWVDPPPVPIPDPPLPANDWAPGTYMMQAVRRVTTAGGGLADVSAFGYDDEISVMAALIQPGKSVGITRPLVEGEQYIILGGGEDLVDDLDIIVTDAATGAQVARDDSVNGAPFVHLTAPQSGNYSLQLQMHDAKRACYACLVVLRKGGFRVPRGNLVTATDRLVGLCNRVSGGDPGAVRFHDNDNQWAIYGGVFDRGQAMTITNLSMGEGRRILLAAGDDNTKDIDLFLLDQAANVLSQDNEENATPVVHFDSAGDQTYGITIKNAAGTRSLILATILELR